MKNRIWLAGLFTAGLIFAGCAAEPVAPTVKVNPDPKTDEQSDEDKEPATPVTWRVSVTVAYLPEQTDTNSSGVLARLLVKEAGETTFSEKGTLDISATGTHEFAVDVSDGAAYQIAATPTHTVPYTGVCEPEAAVSAAKGNSAILNSDAVHTVTCAATAEIFVALTGLGSGSSVELTLNTTSALNSFATPAVYEVDANGSHTLGDAGAMWAEGSYTVTISRQPSLLERCEMEDDFGGTTTLAFNHTGWGSTVGVSCQLYPPLTPSWASTPATVGHKSITVSWAPSAGADNYVVYRDLGAGPVQVAVQTATSYVVAVDPHLATLPTIQVKACQGGANCSVTASLNLATTLSAAEKVSLIGFRKADTPVAGSNFGEAVAMTADGNWLVVGAPNEPVNANTSGAFYLFERSGGSWVQRARGDLTTAGFIDQQGDRFGAAVAIATHPTFGFPVIAVGVPGHKANCRNTVDFACFNAADNSALNSGAVGVYRYYTGNLDFMANIKAPNTHAGASFGASVALSANSLVLAVGAPGDIGNQQGSLTVARGSTPAGGWPTGIISTAGSPSLAETGGVFVYRADAANSNLGFALTGYLKPVDALVEDVVTGGNRTLGGGKSRFGQAVALSSDGTYLAVGAPQDRSFENGVYDSSAGARGVIPETLVGAPGAVHIWAYDAATPSWGERAWVKANDASSRLEAAFGTSVALAASNDDGQLWLTLAAGAPRFETVGGDPVSSKTNAGKVYVYRGPDDGGDTGADLLEIVGAAADDTNPLVAGTGAEVAQARWGTSVALSSDGRTLAAGARGDSGNGFVRTYRLDGTVYAPLLSGYNVMLPYTAGLPNGVGVAVSLSGDAKRMAVGVPGDSCATGGFTAGLPACGVAAGSGAVLMY